MRSASANGVRSTIARSLVKLPAPIGATALQWISPSWNSAAPVVPAPMSINRAPCSRSSGVSTASAVASGSKTISIADDAGARLTQVSSVLPRVVCPVTRCSVTSRREPGVPSGSLIPPCSSTRNSCGMACRISRCMGRAAERAASSARSMSWREISRSLRDTDTMPRELTLRMSAPATPT